MIGSGLLVGSRRGLERHQTLRHAVQWSYDLLDDDEKSLLTRCSVFAGGFDLAGACAVTGSDDDLATLDLLDALVRKSLLVVDRSSGRTRFSMLETIRQFGEEQLVASGDAETARDAHARYFAGREADVLALWDSPRQREAYGWFDARVGQSACRIPLGRRPRRHRHRGDDRDIWRHSSARWSNSTSRWRGPRKSSNPRGPFNIAAWLQLYVTVTQIYMIGRVDDAIRYSERAQNLTANRHFDELSVRLWSHITAARTLPSDARNAGSDACRRPTRNTMTTAMATPGHPWPWR